MGKEDKIKETCAEIADNFAQLGSVASQIEAAAGLLVDAIGSGRKAMFCGNGGSAADSQHLATELMGRYLRDRRPLAAISLTVNTSALTAIGNDYGYEHVFARQVAGLGREGDVLAALSTSGKSVNVLEAARVARDKGIKVVAFTGRDGADLAELADVAIQVPADRTDRIQEMHIAAGHMICEIVEEELC